MEKDIALSSLLSLGIAAAKGGYREKGRAALSQVVEADSGNEIAWTRLAVVVDDPLEAIAALRNTLAINPSNEYALKTLPNPLTKAGVAAARRRERDAALAYLADAVTLNPRNETAPLWRAGPVDAPDEALRLLRDVLAINPAREHARKGVAHHQGIRRRWACPLCQAAFDSGPAGDTCGRCKAVVGIDRPERFEKPAGGDATLLKAAATRLHHSLSDRFDPAKPVATVRKLVASEVGRA